MNGSIENTSNANPPETPQASAVVESQPSFKPAPEATDLSSSISLAPSISLSTSEPPVPETHPDIINNIASTAEIATNNQIPKATIAAEVQQGGPETVRNHFAEQERQAIITTNMQKADQFAEVGNVPQTAYHVEQANKAANENNDGAVEKYAVKHLTKGTDQENSTTEERAWRFQYLQNKEAEIRSQYQEQSLGKKIGEFALNLIPLSFNIAVSGTGEHGKLDSVSDIFSPQEFAEQNVQQLLNSNTLDRNEFIKRTDQLIKNVQEKSDFLGVENKSLQLQVFDAMLSASNNDRVMDRAFTVLDAANVVGSAAKGVVSAGKATKSLIGAQKTIEAANKSNKVALSSGSIANTAKIVGRQDKVAQQSVEVLNSGKTTNLVHSSDAAAKNIAPFAEPLYVKDSTAAQSINLDEFNRGVGAKLADYEEDRAIAEVARLIQEVSDNKTFSPDELIDAVNGVRSKYSNKQLDFHVDVDHALNQQTLEPILQARITQNGGQGFNSASQAEDFVKTNLKIENPWRIEQDVTGKHIIVVDHAQDDFVSMKGFDIAKPSTAMRIINGIYYSKGEVQKGSALSIVNPLGELPQNVQEAGISALTLNRKFVLLKNDIYKRNIETLPKNDIRNLTKVADHFRNNESYAWPSDVEVKDVFVNLTGKEPTVKQMKSWTDYKLLNDIDYTISNLTHRSALTDRNYKTVRFKTSNPEFSNPIAKPIENYTDSMFDDVPHVYDIDQAIYRTIETEMEFNQLKDGGSKFYRLGDYVKIPDETGKIERVAYVVSKNSTEEELPHMVLPYRAGGRIDYAGEWFAKQPNAKTVVVRGIEKKLNHPPITHAIGENRLEIERFVATTNKALAKLRKVEGLHKAGKVASAESMAELEELWSKTRWQSLDNFMQDYRAGEVTLDDLEAVGNRQKLKMGEKYAPQSTGRLGDDDAELELMFNIARRGERKLDPNGMPASLKSPFVSLDEALSSDIKKFTFQNFVQNASDRFAKTFSEDLTDKYPNPINALIHGNFKNDVDVTRKATGVRYQAWLRNLARVGFGLDNKAMDAYASKVAYWESKLEEGEGLNKGYAMARLGVTKWWHTASPPQFFRAAMFETTFGLGNVKQFVTQMNNAFITLGSAIARDPIRGTLATGQFTKEIAVNGTRAIKDAVLMQWIFARNTEKDLHYLNKIVGEIGDGSKPADLHKDFFDSGLETLQRYFGQPEAYDYAESLPATLEKTSDLLAQAKKTGKKTLEALRTPYNAGTKYGNFAGFTYARLKLMDKYGAAAQVDGSLVRSRYLKELRFETERLTFGQSSATNLTIQQAGKMFGARGTLIEFMTQYMQYPIKLLSATLPVAMGGSKAYSTAEKVSMGFTGAALLGAAALPFYNYWSSEAYLEFRKRGWFEGTPQEWRESYWHQGLLNDVINATFGLKGDLSSSFGQQMSPWSQAEDLWAVFSGQKPLGGYVGGPLLNKVVNAFNAVARYDSLQSSFNGTNQGFINSYGVGALLAALQSSVSSLRTVTTLQTALQSDKLFSKKGFAVARSNDTAAWLNVIGVTTSPFEAFEFQKDLLEEINKPGNIHQDIARNLMVQRTQLASEGKYDQAIEVDKALAIQLSLIPPSDRGRFIKSTLKNFNHPILELQRQQIVQALSENDLISDRQGY